jgi:tRNA (cmo5U34)-methyltransferase
MMEQIKKAFDAIATEYDSLREVVIPDLQQFYTTAVWAAESSAPEPAILDIGAGTGLLSALILEKFPIAQMTCWIFLKTCWILPGGGSRAGRILTIL